MSFNHTHGNISILKLSTNFWKELFFQKTYCNCLCIVPMSILEIGFYFAIDEEIKQEY